MLRKEFSLEHGFSQARIIAVDILENDNMLFWTLGGGGVWG